MRSMTAFFNISFKNSFTYRSSVFIGIFGSLFSVITQIALWKYLFSHDAAMTSYMISYVVLSHLLGVVYTNGISTLIGSKVTTGDFVIDLIKPVNPILTYWSTSFSTNIAKLLNRGIPLILVFLPMFFNLQFSFEKILFFGLAIIFGIVISNLIYILVGYLAFLIFEVMPYVRIIDDTIRLVSGAVIPVAFFPSWLEKISHATPFYFLYSFPLRLLLNELPMYEIYQGFIIMSIWVIILSIILKIVYSAALKRSIVQGG